MWYKRGWESLVVGIIQKDNTINESILPQRLYNLTQIRTQYKHLNRIQILPPTLTNPYYPPSLSHPENTHPLPPSACLVNRRTIPT